MTQSHGIPDWSDVSSTLLITLRARALESQTPNPILRDPKAVEITRALDKEPAGASVPAQRSQVRVPRMLAVTMALRARFFDRMTATWLQDHPGGVVVNLGCGLDSRFERIDDGHALWFELDLPEVIEIRRCYFEEGPRRRFVAASVTDLEWTSSLAAQRGQPVLFLAEGLFMYLHEASLRPLIAKLCGDFPGSMLVCELSSRRVVAHMDRWWMRRKLASLGMGKAAAFSFGLGDARELESWAPGVALVDEWSYFDDREAKLRWWSWLGRIDRLRKLQWTAVYRLGGCWAVEDARPSASASELVREPR